MDYILGLDMGSTSLGWSVVELGDNDVPLRLERMGVRILRFYSSRAERRGECANAATAMSCAAKR